MKYDVAIIGGGIIGCATAYRLLSEPYVNRLILLEKESELASHQSGRNSGVIHSGIYYRPGSRKAENCRIGRRQLVEFCDREGIPFDICGKVIVATTKAEIPRLQELLTRGVQNGINCGPIDPDRIREIEPHVSGIAAIRVPDAGIVDYRAVCQRLAELVVEGGFEIRTDTEVTGIESRDDSAVIKSADAEWEADLVINCAGLQSDRVARLSGATPDFKIIPFRGIYYELREDSRYLCRHLVYPVPDPRYPFLGVHFTRMIDGRVECGPNAVLATGREGYSMSKSSLRDMGEMLGFRGFHKLMARNWRQGVIEVGRTVSKRRYLKALQRLIPAISEVDLIPCRSGIRAQAVDRSGEMIDDFLTVESGRVINVCNAPSPAATASLRIAQTILEGVQDRLAS